MMRFLSRLVVSAALAAVLALAASSGASAPRRAALADGTMAAGRLVSRPVCTAPILDGQSDALWTDDAPLVVMLEPQSGNAGQGVPAGVRSVYTSADVYFLLQWQADAPAIDEDTIANLVTVHWEIPPLGEGLRPLSCRVACHTAFANSRGRIQFATAETIPQGGPGRLPVAGVWSDGLWTVEWSRPLQSSNPFDLQMSDLAQEYLFFVKVFGTDDGQPALLSDTYLLSFQR